MQDKASLLRNVTGVLAEDSDYSWLCSVSPESVESLHKLCDEVHQLLLGGPLFCSKRSDRKMAFGMSGLNEKHFQHVERSERAGMLTVLSHEGVRRHCDVLLGLTHAVVHNRDKDSILAKMFFDLSDGIEENCKRVSLAFRELVDKRYKTSESLPWDPNFPLEILGTL